MRSNLVFIATALLLVSLGCTRQEKPAAPETRPATAVHWNRPPLRQEAFAPLPLGSVKPLGWLKRQARIQADGLTGHLDEFWDDVGPNSGWLGGTGESWERGPYYLDGLVPLAYLLDDDALIAKAKKWVEWTIASQRESGAIGPDRNKGKFAQDWQAEDWWPNMVMLKVLTQYQEATGDERVIPLMTKYFHYHLEHAAEVPLVAWAKMRWADELLSIVWLYDRTGDEKLLELARVLQQQSYDWKAQFADFPDAFKRKQGPLTPEARKNWDHLRTHVVNNAMALKTAAVWWQISGDPSDHDAIHQQLAMLDRYHGMPNGVHSGDEHYAGLDPSQGTELCAVVESMFSYEVLIAILGEPEFGDRLERIAYNALPATFKPDMWAHQYDQQVNQVLCSVDKSRNWTTNGPDSNIYGLEPNFGCCTANMHQGWPKLISHLWMATPGGGLAAVAYGPNRVTASVGAGQPVTIEVDTEYPFHEEVTMTIETRSPVEFPLRLRVPGWTVGASISVNGGRPEGIRPGAYHLVSRTWRSGDKVELVFPMPVIAERRYRNSVVLRRGPLVYSLKLGERWKKIAGEEPHADWEVAPTTPWNYGLVVDLQHPERSVRTEIWNGVGARPFSPDGAPLELRLKARRIPGWKLVHGSAGPLPESPTTSPAREEWVTLIPYGSTNLRVTEFPLLRK